MSSLSSSEDHKELNKETEIEIRAKLVEEYNSLKEQYEQHINQFSSIPVNQSEREKIIIELLHEYNEIKDACQIILGAAANLHQCTIKEMHLKYNLPLNDE